VNFDYLNLNDDSYPSIFNGTNAQDLILCRNVLIYLDNDRSAHLMHKINKSLIQGGYLLLGASDPINIAGTDFIFHHQEGLFFSRPTLEQKKVVTLQPIVEPASQVSEIIQREIKTDKVEQGPTSIDHDDLTIQAIELANLGRLEEAIKLCEEGFKVDPTNKLTYFTYGLALSELNQFSEAEAALRKAVFLDNQFVAGHFQLGLLLLRKNKYAAGLKSLKNALAIAEARKPEDTVPGSPGLCYQHLADILRNEINLYLEMGT
jgi:chemotaxis protein methyltransferase CheR